MYQPDRHRITIPAAEEILGRYFPVLDHGFVALVDYMGGDAAIEQAARVSYGGNSTGRVLLEFTPLRLVIPSTIRQYFRVNDFYISSPDMLGQNFTELTANDIDLKHSDSTKQFLTISVTNLTEQGRNFQAAVVGISPQGKEG